MGGGGQAMNIGVFEVALLMMILMRRKDIYTYLQIQVFLGSFILAKGAISVSC